LFNLCESFVIFVRFVVKSVIRNPIKPICYQIQIKGDNYP